jgi:hypothetical protein
MNILIKPPLNPPRGTYLNEEDFKAPPGGFGGKDGIFQLPLIVWVKIFWIYHR